MDANTTENVHYKFELKKIKDDELSFSNAKIHSEPWSDDLDSSFEDKPLENNVDNNVSYSILYGKNSDEAKLMEENIDLYSDLIKIEEERKKAKQIREAEFENCKKEIEKLKETDAKNKSRIEELNKENANLKQSISSLYRTVKREIEFKDKMLAEANSKISRLESITGCGTTFQENETYPNYVNYSSTSRKDNNFYKRKRSESPESSYKKRDYISGSSRSYEAESETNRRKGERKPEHEIIKNDHDLDESEKDKRKTEKNPEQETSQNKHDLDLATNKDEENVSHKQASKNTNNDKETQISNHCIFCKTHKSSNVAKTSRDPREVNDMFFNLLPDSLKQSFYDYEQDQMISLNRLKESFIDEYLNSKSGDPSPVLESTPKTKDNRTVNDQLTSNKKYKNRSSSTASTPTSSSEHNRNSESGRRGRRYENEARKDYAQSHAARIPRNCYNSRLDKNHVISLFKYRKEKMPFTEKKKFGLHKDDKKLIPEKLL